jgi:hypothetical protein
VAELEQLALDSDVAQRGFSRAIRTTRAARASSIGGVRPGGDRSIAGGRGGDATAGSCLGSPGGWRRSARAAAGRGRRTPPGPRPCADVNWCGRRMATSWRSTRSSMSLAVDVRHDSRTNPSTCPKINYSNRGDTPESMSDRRSPLIGDPARLLAPTRSARHDRVRPWTRPGSACPASPTSGKSPHRRRRRPPCPPAPGPGHEERDAYAAHPAPATAARSALSGQPRPALVATRAWTGPTSGEA